MKKRTAKKLKLTSETLRVLEQSDFGDVMGGLTQSDCSPSNCQPICNCNTRLTCSSFYC
jgi:hypothetical protein